jgi:hypothetical protein
MSNQSKTPRTDAFARLIGKELAQNRRDCVTQMNAMQTWIDLHVAPMETELNQWKQCAEELVKSATGMSTYTREGQKALATFNKLKGETK